MRQIFAMGGGGFSEEPDNPLLDEYVLRMTGRAHPAVLFLPTASGDAEGYIARFHEAFGRLGARTAHLSLFRPPEPDLRALVLRQDAVYVGGGNTRNLLALWRLWGLDAILREAWEQGVVLAGLSAGAVCWFAQGLTDSWPGEIRRLGGLGFLPGSLSAHYDADPIRREAFLRLLAAGEMRPGYAADNGAGLHFIGRKLHAAVASRPTARVYRLRRRAQGAVEQAMPIAYLGAQEGR